MFSSQLRERERIAGAILSMPLRSGPRGPADRAAFESALEETAVIEEFHGYPGPALMAALRNRADGDDAAGAAALAWRIASALLTRSFRQHASDWDPHSDISSTVPDVLPPTLGRPEAALPYFEVLIVTGAPIERWASIASEWRRLRRPQDKFVYEPVIVGSAEDARLRYDVERRPRRRGDPRRLRISLAARCAGPSQHRRCCCEGRDFGRIRFALGARHSSVASRARSLSPFKCPSRGDRRRSGSRHRPAGLLRRRRAA